jgi:hypothetical protein
MPPTTTGWMPSGNHDVHHGNTFQCALSKIVSFG